MLRSAEVEREENALPERLAALPDDLRRDAYEEISRRTKDPDTYATLNWFLVAGLHHFYAGQILRGSVVLGLFLLSIILVWGNPVWLLVLVGIVAWEMVELFRSQVIVRDLNNRHTRRVVERFERRRQLGSERSG